MTMSSSPATSDFDSPDAELVGRVTALVPLIREYAAQGSEARRVAPEVMKALEDADVFRLLVPKRYGGHEATLRTAVEAVTEVARGDGSTGWIAALMTVATGFAATASEQAQEEVFGSNPKAKVCGVFSLGSKSERVDGGYLVSGRWPYASGSFAADWASLGITIEGDDSPAMALIPAEAWTIEPTWFVAGMKGTGSDTIVVEDHFVPEHRVQRTKDMFEGNYLTPYTDERMASIAFNAVAAAILVAPQIGLGRHALEITRAKLPHKPVAYTSYQQARLSPTHQVGVANAATKLHLAELLLNRMCFDIDRAATERRQPDLETRGRIRNDTGVVAELITEAIHALLTANGAGSFAEVNVFNRIWRDSETAARHALVTPEIGKEAYGRLLLGNEEPTIGL
ncbi:acyl-CoA dehydrogenase family protein [Streptomyces sp. PSKA54]|uniref:Acyl-CoA dehydrogenase family protein n=1 Tax=Streptomyces himalayensis subsp. aureolus TaxID=2758039 RepID=A0A7W2HIL3_9ACTN|nr:acyl-CoA dehydrogenase family protein [Streptomyces himalayensis]MBA4865171.1 acyl-CoA dehydrogenase family protein [Streptomyces himalayensis subsp. aureolus]